MDRAKHGVLSGLGGLGGFGGAGSLGGLSGAVGLGRLGRGPQPHQRDALGAKQRGQGRRLQISRTQAFSKEREPHERHSRRGGGGRVRMSRLFGGRGLRGAKGRGALLHRGGGDGGGGGVGAEG